MSEDYQGSTWAKPDCWTDDEAAYEASTWQDDCWSESAEEWAAGMFDE